MTENTTTLSATAEATPRGLTVKQIERLLNPVRRDRIETKNRLSYVPAHEVKAELTRTFGPGNWDHAIHDVTALYETVLVEGDPQYPDKAKGSGKTYYVVCYSVACTLRVRDYWGNPVFETTEYHAEENAPLPNRGEAHAMALTSAQSYALRRAALDLGDAMGLHLYDKGSLGALIVGTLAIADPDSPNHQKPPKNPGPAEEGPVEKARRQVAQSMGGQVVDSGGDSRGEGAPSVDQYAEGMSEESA